MWISRLRVNGGFLAGLDLTFSRGLNVIVGPRGAGKTTLLELMRHGLGVRHADEARAREQQLRVAKLLGSGEVIIDLESDFFSRRAVVDADGGGRLKETSDLALMLAQNELESIASSASSRLALIDLRARVHTQVASTSDVADLTRRLAELREQIEHLTDQSRLRQGLLADREALAAREQELLAQASASLTSKRAALQTLEIELLKALRHADDLASVDALLNHSIADGDSSRQALEQVLDATVLSETAPALRVAVQLRAAQATALVDQMNLLQAQLRELASATSERALALRGQAAPLRAELEEAEVGLGQVTAQVRNIDGQLQRLDATERLLVAIRAEYEQNHARRNFLLRELEQDRETLYEARRAVAHNVSSQLDARVSVRVDHLADSRRFRHLLVEALQGSGLQYRPLADLLARELLPTQLLRLVESGDVGGLAAATGVSSDRAARVTSQLGAPSTLSSLASAYLDDRVDFFLQDGAHRKSVEDLSTGQKCSVTLPIVLSEHGRVVILDQPEDHLDNAYLVENVVRTLIRRKHDDAQTIVATHNANIPVLGGAESVFCLESDGSRGRVKVQGPFDDNAVVSVITQLMEGGATAFRQRAAFYATFGNL